MNSSIIWYPLICIMNSSIIWYPLLIYKTVPRGGLGGVEVENVSSVFSACRKRRLIGAVCRNHRIKRPRVVAWTGTLKNPAKCLWRLEPDRRSNYFFFSPPAHLCAVTCMTKILLIVKLNNKFTSITELSPYSSKNEDCRREIELSVVVV